MLVRKRTFNSLERIVLINVIHFFSETFSFVSNNDIVLQTQKAQLLTSLKEHIQRKACKKSRKTCKKSQLSRKLFPYKENDPFLRNE